MQTRTLIGCLALSLAALMSAAAQQPESTERPGKKPAISTGADGFINRMLKLDANDDGKLSREEVQDPRLKPLFDRADADQNGTLTKAELTDLFQKEAPKASRARPGGQPMRRGAAQSGENPGPPLSRGRGQVGPPRPGQILPPFMQEGLELTDEQRKQIDELQQEVDERLGKILTDEQKQRLSQARPRGPDGPRRGNEEEPPGIPFDPVEIPEQR